MNVFQFDQNMGLIHLVGGDVSPSSSGSYLSRPRLKAVMNADWLALEVVAGPGFGKTALVSRWASTQSLPVTWIEANAHQNWPFSTSATTPTLPTGGLLVIDHADQVSQPEFLAWLQSLVGHYRLVLISRGPTHVPLSNLRIQGQVRSILADDLRFTLRESYTLLETIGQSRLGREQIRTLWTFCRGWVTGFALAQHVEHQVQGTGEFGRREWMMWDQLLDDYISEQVLTYLPADLLQMMIDTADLSFFSEDLNIPDLSHTNLQRLVAAVSMLEEDDSQPGRYRYDPLLAASLRRLAQKSSAGPWPSPSRRSLVEQLANRGDVRAAADLALRIGDADLLQKTVRQVGKHLAERSKLGELIMWLDHLPRQQVFHDPDLDYWWMIARLGLGRTFGVRERLRLVESEWLATGEPLLEGRLLLVRGVLAFHDGDGREATRLLREARNVLPVDAEIEHLYAQTFAGRQYVRDGSDNRAVEPLAAAELTLRRQSLASDWGWRTVAADRANTYATRGDLASAKTKYRLMLAELPDPAPEIEGFLRCRLLAIEIERDQLEDAAVNFERIEDLLGIDVLQWRNDAGVLRIQSSLANHYRLDVVDWRHDAALARIRLMLAQGQVDDAEQWGSGYLKLVRHLPQKEQIVLMLAYIWLERGEWSMVDSWLRDVGTVRWPWAKSFGDINPTFLAIDLDLARGNVEAALRRAEALTIEAAATRRWAEYVGLSMRLAVARDLTGNEEGAQQAVAQASEVGLSGGFVRSFRVPGWNVVERFSHLWPSGVAPGSHPVTEPTVPENLVSAASPLSLREEEVLLLVAQGLSNKQIATALYISVNTVRNHLVRISRRLNATSRTEVVARARKLGILS